VLNVALGGTLEPHMAQPHRHLVHQVQLDAGSVVAGATGAAGLTVSCYHHQRIARLAAGLVPTAHASDGTVEAVELADRASYVAAVQWHPEDTAASDDAQLRLFADLVGQARCGRRSLS
jgi:putative glutamine amidotransferase